MAFLFDSVFVLSYSNPQIFCFPLLPLACDITQKGIHLLRGSHKTVLDDCVVPVGLDAGILPDVCNCDAGKIVVQRDNVQENAAVLLQLIGAFFSGIRTSRTAKITMLAVMLMSSTVKNARVIPASPPHPIDDPL